MRKQIGLTLVELIITLAIAGILIVGAIPSFAIMLDNSRGFDQANAYFNALSFARGQAVNLGQRVTVCNLSDVDGVTCTNEWYKGAAVFIDFDGDGILDGSEQVLRRVPGLAANDTHSINRDRVTFNAEGMAISGSNGTFAICPSGNVEIARKITISSSGRVRVTHQSDATTAFSCS
jgi:prepilin-type N-terminal cleavage/methylation domain-containing protein